MTDDKRDNVTFLLKRAMDDDGPEGEIAWNMFVTRAKAEPGKIMFVPETRDNSNPLWFLIEDYRRKIEALEEELADVKQRIARAMKSFQKVIS